MATNVGTQIKFNVSLTLPGGLTMDDIRFSAAFFIYSNRVVTVEKEQMQRIDANNYIAICDTARTGSGEIRMRVIAYLPDGAGERMEIETVSTKVIVVS